jgi:glucoamylase
MSLWKPLFAMLMSLALNANASPLTAPFSNDELQSVKTNLFNNILDQQHTFIKNDNGKMIYSLPGAVMASPSNKGDHFSQDYQFHWTRDAAITMQEVVALYKQATGEEKQKLKSYLLNYIQFESKAQKQISKKGEQTLGQPKFNLDGTIWEGQWMRPQNDGPALRAITLIDIATLWLEEDESFVRNHIAPLIKTDLDYLVDTWQATSFDLWEEINDPKHFFTQMVQRKGLIRGANFFNQLGQKKLAARYEKTSQQITASLLKHWDENRGYFAETIQQQYIKGGGINTSILLGLTLGNLNDSKDEMAMMSSKSMSSAYFIRNAFALLYKINLTAKAPLLGRYPNDIYDGDQFIYGNPWILTSNVLAEYYYTLASALAEAGELPINDENRPFLQQIDPQIDLNMKRLSRKNQPREFNRLLISLINAGDNILVEIKKYGTCYPDHTCYHFAEQLDRATGTQTSAKDLTWGYTSILTAMQARAHAISIL